MQKVKKLGAVKVGVTRASVLFDKDPSTIRRRCALGLLPARQEFNGAAWDIFIPQPTYDDLIERMRLTNKKR